jgi:hypothetical protein
MKRKKQPQAFREESARQRAEKDEAKALAQKRPRRVRIVSAIKKKRGRKQA